MKVNLQATVVKGVNDRSTGDIVRFAIDNIDKVRSVVFQPIMFTGRDANVPDDVRRARRYTLADLATDLGQQASFDWSPMRDWFPMSAYSVFGHLFDVLHPDAAMGSLYADFHPSEGVFSALLVNQTTKAVVPISSCLNVERLLTDVTAIADGGGPAALIRTRVGLSILRNFDLSRAPEGFTVKDLMRLFEQFTPRFRSDMADWQEKDNTYSEWRLLLVTGIWFQDAFNFDFAVARMDPVVTATGIGEISFCGYNGGGWRQVLEHVQKTAGLADWHRSHGRHRIYANGAAVPIYMIPRGEERVSAVTHPS